MESRRLSRDWELDANIKCLLCFKNYLSEGSSAPTRLSCGHSLCISCATKLASATTRSNNQVIHCPVCLLQSENLIQPDADIISRLATSPNHSETKDIACENCTIEMASSYCKTCMLSLCSDCNRKIHTKTTGAIIQHEIVSNVNREIALHAEKCDLHRTKDLNKYCFSCNQSICEVCKSGDHHGHDVSSAVDVATAKRKEMSLLLDNAWRKLEAAEEMASHIESTINKICPDSPNDAISSECSAARAKAAIDAHFDDIIAALNLRRAHLITRVDQMAESKIALLRQQLASVSVIHANTYKCAHTVSDLLHQNDIIVARDTAHIVKELASAVERELVDEVGLVDSEKIPFHFDEKFIDEQIVKQGCVGGPGRPVGLTASMVDFNAIVKWKAPDATKSNSGTGVVAVGDSGNTTESGAFSLCTDTVVDSYLIQAAIPAHELSSLQVGTGRDLDFFDVAVVDANTTEVVMDSKKYPNQYMYIRVCAINSLGAHGAHSKVVKVHTPADFSHLCVFDSPFDRNGALYWIGTSCNTQEYRNPHSTGDIMVTCSSVYYGHPCSIASEGFVGDVSTSNSSLSWIQVDLGANKRITPSHYCLRSGTGEGGKPRNWSLQARNQAADTWVTLREHKNDISLAASNCSTASWKIDNEHGKMYRMFRILQTGCNSTGSRHLKLSGLELYGSLLYQPDNDSDTLSTAFDPAEGCCN